MERLLVLKLDAAGCEAEAWLNGVAVARVDAACPRAIIPIHEYTLAGTNRLELVAWPRPAAPKPGEPVPPPLPLVSDGKLWAHLRVLLPRDGSPVDEGSVRTLAHLEWAPPAGEAYQAPLSLTEDVSLPVAFPRWRWLDAPPAEVTPALHQQAFALVQGLAQDLAGGEVARFLSATRLRTEELASAYQRPPEEAVERLRNHLEGLRSATWQALEPEGLILRRLAGGRLLECLDASGQPALRSEPDELGRSHGLPLRLSCVEGKLYVLR